MSDRLKHPRALRRDAALVYAHVYTHNTHVSAHARLYMSMHTDGLGYVILARSDATLPPTATFLKDFGLTPFSPATGMQPTCNIFATYEQHVYTLPLYWTYATHTLHAHRVHIG